jgi:hypothetical protein
VENQNPDECGIHYALAVELSERFLKHAVTQLPKSCTDLFAKLPRKNADFRSRTWKQGVLGTGWGPRWAIEVLKYRFQLAPKYGRIAASEPRVRWFVRETTPCDTVPIDCSEKSECGMFWKSIEEKVSAVLAPPADSGGLR